MTRNKNNRGTLAPQSEKEQADGLSPEAVKSIRDELVHPVGYKHPPKDTQFKKGQ